MNKKRDTDLVGHIAGFTALRDVDLLELSLLKSIYTALRPVNVSLISLDTNNIILKRIDYASNQYGHVTLKVPAQEHLLLAVEQLDMGGREYCNVVIDSTTLTTFLLSQTRRVSHYICIEAAGNSVTQNDSQQIIGMLRVFQNFRALLNESQTDELTGLPNRKAFNGVASKINETLLPSPEIIEEDKRDADHQPENFWLALVDLDNFKSINDNHGHLMGDEVLVRVAQTMQASLREDDMVFRYGGEEFAIILAIDESEQVKAVLERVRVSIAELNLHVVGKITASMGVIKMKKHVFHLSLIEMADKALYESKANGKNQITFATESFQHDHQADDGEIELF